MLVGNFTLTTVYHLGGEVCYAGTPVYRNTLRYQF